jgi:hypothetical protein
MQDGQADVLDTPIHRSTVNQLAVDQLDAFLDGVRERRLVRVQKLEKVAKVRAEDAHLATYLKFETTHAKARKLLDKLAEDEQRAEQYVNKLRVLAMEMGA